MSTRAVLKAYMGVQHMFCLGLPLAAASANLHEVQLVERLWAAGRLDVSTESPESVTWSKLPYSGRFFGRGRAPGYESLRSSCKPGL